MIRAGIIGVGYWGPNLLRNLVENLEVQVKWVCDKNPRALAKMTRRYPGVQGTEDAGEIIKDNAVDLVVIATPVQSHARLAISSLTAGKHVLVTKPMALSVVECQEMIDCAQRCGRILMVDHTFVYHPAVRHMAEMIGRKEMGELLYFQSTRMNLGLYQPDVSVIYDLMSHDLSILNELVKEDPVEISVSSKHAARLPQPDIAYLQLNYHSDFIASVQASWLSPSKIRQTLLTGSKRMVIYDDNDVLQKVKVFDKGVDTVNFTDKEAGYTQFIQYRQGDVYSPALPTTEALKLEIDHLVECIQHQKTPRTNGHEGLRVVRLLEYADQLARANQCWIALPTTSRTSLKAA